MSLTERISSLKQKHRDLDAEIERLSLSPSSAGEVNELKRQKLHLRDEIARLESEDARAA